MKKKLAGIALVLGLAFAGAAQAGTVTFIVPMDGAQEFPGPGDPDGVGTATLTIDDVALTVDWNFDFANIDLPLTGAHIHKAPAGVAGPVIVNFNAMASGTGLFDGDLAAVLADPTGHYVNLHNALFPGGAIRGQLPEPTTLGLLAVGMLALVRRKGVRG